MFAKIMFNRGQFGALLFGLAKLRQLLRTWAPTSQIKTKIFLHFSAVLRR